MAKGHAKSFDDSEVADLRAHRPGRATDALTFVFSRDADECDDLLAAQAAPTEPINPIAALDLWSRHIWRHRRMSPWILVAVPIWLFVRTFYRACLLVSLAVHYVSRPLKWLYWRAYELCGPGARLAKFVFWRALHPILESAARLSTTAYWRLYETCGPPARAVRVLRRPLEQAARQLAHLLRPRQSSARDARTTHTRGIRDADAVVLACSTLADFGPLFDCAPLYGLSAPAPAPLYVLLGASLCKESRSQLGQLGLRLRSGSPCQDVYLYASSEDDARMLSGALDLDVRYRGALDRTALLRLVRDRALTESPSLTLDRFGPVVLLISALWGRVGSTSVFDAQTRHLLERGAFVVRVFLDHNPGASHEGPDRVQKLVQENLATTRPHIVLTCKRPTSEHLIRRLRRSKEYKSASGVRRLELELRDAGFDDPVAMSWAVSCCELVLVNHAAHMAFAERVANGAPIVLETHDILTQQLDSHGWPSYVSLKEEPVHLRDLEQQKMWGRAAACVNLSPDDHAAIAGHNTRSHLIRPAVDAANPALRPWDEVVAANALNSAFARSEFCDVLVWGDWHDANARAIVWFLDQVIARHPELGSARVAVVGRVTRRLPPRLRRLPNVMVAGFVDRLEDFIGRATILAVPDQDGSGVSIKAVDALRSGKPFVSTRVGLRGLDLSGAEVPLHQSAASFSEDLARLLRDKGLRDHRAKTAARIYAANFSKEVYDAAWDNVLAQVAPGLGKRAASRMAQAAPPASGPAESAPTAPLGGASARTGQKALGAIVCTYNRYELLDGAIASLLGQDLSMADLEIVVVDNSPDQDRARRHADRYAGSAVRYLLEPTPGLSNARNVGANACNAEFVAYIDDDAVADRSWARRLLQGFRSFPGCAGVAGGRITPRWLSPRPEWLPDELLGNLSLVDWGGSTREVRSNEWLAGCNIGFDRNALLDLGGFSPALGRTGAGSALLSNEENAVIRKFSALGKSVLYVPDAVVEHLIDPSRLSQQWFRRRAAWQAVSDYIAHPDKTAAYAGAAAERLRRELQSGRDLPPGFVSSDSDREAFRRDVGLMYDVIVAMLAGGVELDQSPSLKDGVMARVRREVQRNPNLRSVIRNLTNT